MESEIASLLTDYKQYECKRDSIGLITNFSKPISDRSKLLCKLNEKLSIHVTVWTYQGNSSITISIRAETNQSLWITIAFYSLSYTDVADGKLIELENKLIKSWEILNDSN